MTGVFWRKTGVYDATTVRDQSAEGALATGADARRLRRGIGARGGALGRTAVVAVQAGGLIAGSGFEIGGHRTRDDHATAARRDGSVATSRAKD